MSLAPHDEAQTAAPDPAAVISTRGLTKVYGDQVALDHIDLDVAPGTIVGLIGPSGCGKSTLVRNLTGITSPTSGTVRVFGRDPIDFRTAQRVRFGYMPQLPVLFPNLSIWSNLTFISSVYGMKLRGRRQRLMNLLELVDLAEHRSKQLADCSGGMQRRLALAATLVHDPELLFLDEPTAGVDPILRERFWGHFRSLRDAGKTIIVPTQYVGEAVSCDHVAVMSAGQLLTVQRPTDLARFAYDGDPLAVRLGGGWLSGEEVQRLRSLDFVREVQRASGDLIVAVEDGVRDTPRLQHHLAGVAPRATVEPVEPTYDELFLTIIQRHRDELAAQEGVAA